MNGTPAPSIDVALGKALRRLRSEAGLTQADLAHRIGVSFQQVQKYESGLNRMSVNRLIQCAEVLGTSASEILQDLSEPRAQAERQARARKPAPGAPPPKGEDTTGGPPEA